MIENKLKVGYFIGSVGKGMHGLGTPEDLKTFSIILKFNENTFSSRYVG